MADNRNYYVYCDDNCRFPAMTAEQVLAAIHEATGVTPTEFDEAFISKIKDQNTNSSVKIWTGSEAEFNAIVEKDQDTIYLVGTKVLGKSATVNYIATLGTDWISADGYVYQEVEVQGLTFTDTPIISLIADMGNFKNEQYEWSKILKATAENNKAIFYAERATTKELSIIIKAVR